MKSRPFRFQNKLFRYDFDSATLEYIVKATKEDIADEEETFRKLGRHLCEIVDGYMILDTVGLRRENWNNKAARNEYLFQWCADLDEEMACMVHDFEKYELPQMKG